MISTKQNMKLENTNINIWGMDMMGLKKRNKPKESTDVLIKLKISVPDVDNSDSCNVVDSLLNEIWDTAWSKEGVEVENLRATYVKEKTTK